MKIEHEDGGPFVVTLSLREAQLASYSVTQMTAGGEHMPECQEWLRFQAEVLRALLVPGSKDEMQANRGVSPHEEVVEGREKSGADYGFLNYTEAEHAEIQRAHDAIAARKRPRANTSVWPEIMKRPRG